MTLFSIMYDIVSLQTEWYIPWKAYQNDKSCAHRCAQIATFVWSPFCNVGPCMRVIQITDSGHVTQLSCYPIEARIVLLSSDYHELRQGRKEEFYGRDASIFGGYTCVLYMSSKKAQRVSYSTSHSETNSAAKAIPMGQMIALRYAEPELVASKGGKL